MPLQSVIPSAVIPENAKENILYFAQKGQYSFTMFVQKRLLLSPQLSVWDPLKKVEAENIHKLEGKSAIKVGSKVIQLLEERALLGRFLIIQQSRPELVPKLENTIGHYEMSVVPRSLSVLWMDPCTFPWTKLASCTL